MPQLGFYMAAVYKPLYSALSKSKLGGPLRNKVKNKNLRLAMGRILWGRENQVPKCYNHVTPALVTGASVASGGEAIPVW